MTTPIDLNTATLPEGKAYFYALVHELTLENSAQTFEQLSALFEIERMFPLIEELDALMEKFTGLIKQVGDREQYTEYRLSAFPFLKQLQGIRYEEATYSHA